MNAPQPNNPFEQLHALLNWPPEEVFTSVGEVKAFITEIEETRAAMAIQIIGADAAMVEIAKDLGAAYGPLSEKTTILVPLGKLAGMLATMADWALERDMVACKALIAFFEGNDAEGAE